jgi:hypothetical protein
MSEDRAEIESIVDLLRVDDAQIAALFERHAAAEKNPGQAAVCDRLVARICETLTIQRLAEEEVLYPAIRASDDKLVFAFLLAGLGISMRIGEIRDSAKPRATRDLSVLRLKDLVERNLLERSQILFPFVRGRLSRTQLTWLGDDYRQRKTRLWTNADAAHAPRPQPRRLAAVLPWRQRARHEETRPW